MKDGMMRGAVTTDLSTVVERMRDKRTLFKEEKPQLLFSATFGRKGYDDVTRMTGLLLMTAESDHEQTVSEWLQKVGQVPYTAVAFRSDCRHLLHVVIRVGFADGHEAKDSKEYLRMLRQAQQQVAPVYLALADCTLQKKELTLLSGVPMSYDPQVFYHPDAQAFPVVMKEEGILVKYQDTKVDTDGSVQYYPDHEERKRLRKEYYACLQRALEDFPDAEEEEQVLATLAGYCQKARLEEEACVRHTLWQWRFHEDEDIVRKIFRTAYMKKFRGKAVSQMNQKERIAYTIRDFFERRYQLRYNEVKQLVEFRPNDQTFPQWQPLGERDLKRIAFEEMLEGGHGWQIDIDLYVHSSLIPRYNPIHEFLGGVGQWDQQKDYIGEYAQRLKTDYEQWQRFFHRWFLAMVAQAMNKSRDFGNSMVPMLIGTQAMKKSTFCKNILPYSLREYYMDDLKMDNAEQVERVLGRMWLVNIDEYNAKTEREQAKIKRLLTEKDVQIRKMRSDQYTMTSRLCSFIATTNDRQPLTDPTGSRRYLCVEMTGEADMSGTINYQQMYAQAVWEIAHDEQYWFDHDDEREIMEHNRPYQLRCSVEDMICDLLKPAPKTKENFMTATTIQQLLRQHLLTADVPTLGKLGRALHRQHFPEGSLNGTHGYYLGMKSQGATSGAGK